MGKNKRRNGGYNPNMQQQQGYGWQGPQGGHGVGGTGWHRPPPPGAPQLGPPPPGTPQLGPPPPHGQYPEFSRPQHHGGYQSYRPSYNNSYNQYDRPPPQSVFSVGGNGGYRQNDSWRDDGRHSQQYRPHLSTPSSPQQPLLTAPPPPARPDFQNDPYQIPTTVPSIPTISAANTPIADPYTAYQQYQQAYSAYAASLIAAQGGSSASAIAAAASGQPPGVASLLQTTAYAHLGQVGASSPGSGSPSTHSPSTNSPGSHSSLAAKAAEYARQQLAMKAAAQQTAIAHSQLTQQQLLAQQKLEQQQKELLAAYQHQVAAGSVAHQAAAANLASTGAQAVSYGHSKPEAIAAAWLQQHGSSTGNTPADIAKAVVASLQPPPPPPSPPKAAESPYAMSSVDKKPDMNQYTNYMQHQLSKGRKLEMMSSMMKEEPVEKKPLYTLPDQITPEKKPNYSIPKPTTTAQQTASEAALVRSLREQQTQIETLLAGFDQRLFEK